MFLGMKGESYQASDIVRRYGAHHLAHH